MKMKEWRYRFYEDEEIELDEIEALDNTEADKVIPKTDSWKNTKDNSISQSQIQSIVKSEIQRQMKSSSLDKSSSSKGTTDIASDKQKKGDDEHSLYQQRLGQQKSRQQQPHSRPHSQIDFHLPKKGHRNKKKPAHNHSPQRRKTMPTPHVNVIYRHLEMINQYPDNHGAQIRFNHKIMGSYIIYSPIIGGEGPDTSMKNVLRFQRMCIQKRYKYLPLYTRDDNGNIIDICFIVYPRHQVEEQFTCLELSVLEFMNQTKTSFSYLKCEGGVLILKKENKTFIYAYDNLNMILNDYSKARKLDLSNGANHYFNPYPQSNEELEYRKNNLEIVLPRKKPAKDIRHKYYG